MFNKTFYPTPQKIADKMISKIKQPPKFVCDPSGGKGDLLEACRRAWNYRDVKYYCIEKEPDLQRILIDKGFQLLDSDFLTYSGSMQFNAIIMNPPFDHGVDHLLKAWNIMYNGQIICLLNEETYNNPHTKERQLLKNIIDEHGEVEHLGACFDKAERTTGVNVIMVSLEKKNSVETNYFKDLKNSKSNRFQKSSVNAEALTIKNNIESMVQQYEEAIKCATEGFIKLQEAHWYAGAITSGYSNPLRQFSIQRSDLFNSSNYTHSLNETLNAYIEELKIGAWRNILKITQFQDVMTEKVHDEFSSRMNELSNKEFTVDNIEALLHELRMSQGNIMESAVLETFDLITKYYKENRVHFEGWKTNSSWKIGRRFILPNMVSYPNWSGDFGISYHHQRDLQDIEKVISMLDGKRDAGGYIEKLITGSVEKSGETKHFRLKWYKKGTLHFEFKDLKLLERFNFIACQGKKWLPPAEDKTQEAERIMIEFKK